MNELIRINSGLKILRTYFIHWLFFSSLGNFVFSTFSTTSRRNMVLNIWAQHPIWPRMFKLTKPTSKKLYLRQENAQKSPKTDICKRRQIQMVVRAIIRFFVVWVMLLLLLPKKRFGSFAWSSICLRCGRIAKKLQKKCAFPKVVDD